MGTPFNLSANLTVQGPKNIPGIVADIRKQLKGLTADVKINIDASSVRNLTAFNAQLKQTSTLLAQLAQQNTNAANSFNKANTSAQTLGKTVHEVGVGARQAASDMYLFGQQAGHAARRFLAFAAPVATLFALKKAISEGVKEAIDFEKQMLVVSQVSGKTFDQLKPLSKEIGALSRNLGVSSKELAAAAQTLAQAGLSATDTTKALDGLAKTKLVGTFGEIKDTTEGLIAVMNQFKIGAGQFEQAFADVNRVTGEFASESKDIFTAASKAGGSFAAAGGTFKEFTAIVTTLRDTTRESAETIATGLQTIFARLQRTDTIDSLRDMGIELRDLNGEFIGPTQAILKIGDALKNVSTKGQKFSDIKELLGGTRQIGKVVPLLQNTDKLKEINKIAGESEENLRRFGQSVAQSQDILATKITKVTEQFNELFRNITNDAAFKAMANTALDLASAFIRVADSLRPLLPLLITLKSLSIASSAAQFGSGFLGGVSKVSAKDLGTRGASLLTGRAQGGIIPGSGNKDSEIIAAMPGEYIINKRSAQRIGYGTLSKLNKFAEGGLVGGDLPNRDERGRFLPKSPEKLYSALLKLANSTDKLTEVQKASLRNRGSNVPGGTNFVTKGQGSLTVAGPNGPQNQAVPGTNYPIVPYNPTFALPIRSAAPFDIFSKGDPLQKVANQQKAKNLFKELGKVNPYADIPKPVHAQPAFDIFSQGSSLARHANQSKVAYGFSALSQINPNVPVSNLLSKSTQPFDIFSQGDPLAKIANQNKVAYGFQALSKINPLPPPAPAPTPLFGINKVSDPFAQYRQGGIQGRINAGFANLSAINPLASGDSEADRVLARQSTVSGFDDIRRRQNREDAKARNRSFGRRLQVTLGSRNFEDEGYFPTFRRAADAAPSKLKDIYNRGLGQNFRSGLGIAATGSLLASGFVDNSTRGGSQLSAGLAAGGGTAAILGAINPLAGALVGLTVGLVAAGRAAREFDKQLNIKKLGQSNKDLLLLANGEENDGSNKIRRSGENFRSLLEKSSEFGDNSFANISTNIQGLLGGKSARKHNAIVSRQAQLEDFQTNTAATTEASKAFLESSFKKGLTLVDLKKGLSAQEFRTLLTQAGAQSVNANEAAQYDVGRNKNFKVDNFQSLAFEAGKKEQQILSDKAQKDREASDKERAEIAKNINVLTKLSTSFYRLNIQVEEAVSSLNKFAQQSQISDNIFSGGFNKIDINDESANLRGVGPKFNKALSTVSRNLGVEGSFEVGQLKELNRARTLLPNLLLRAGAEGNNGEGLLSATRGQLNVAGFDTNSSAFRTIISGLTDKFKDNQRQEVQAKLANGGAESIADELLTSIINKQSDDLISAYKTLVSTIDGFGEDLEKSSRKLKQVNESREKVEEKTLNLDKFIASRKAEQVNGNPANFLSLDKQTAGFGKIQNQLTGLGDNATNPTAVAGLLRTLAGEQEGAVKRRNLASKSLNPKDDSTVVELENASKSLADLQFRTANASEALERLANRSDKLAAAQERLVALEGDKEGRLDFFTRFAGADREGRGELNKEAQAAFKAFQTRDLNKLSIDEQNQATRFLSSNPNLRLGGTDVTGSQLLRQLADVGIGGVNAKQTDEDKKESEFLKDIIQGELQGQIVAQKELTGFLKTQQEKFFTQLSESFDTFLSKLGNAKGFAGGGTVFKARGTDTVPAMLSPDEVIVSAGNAKKNKGILAAIQGGMNYFADGRYPFKMPNRKVDSDSAYQNNPHQQLRYESSRRSPVYDEEGSFGLQERNDLVMFNDRGAATHSRQATGKIPVPKSAKQVSDERIAARLGRAVRPVGEAYTNQAIINPKRVNPVKASDSELADQGKLDAFNRKLGRSGANNDAQLLQKSRADAQRQLKNLATDARQYNSPQNQAKLAKQALVEAGGNATQAASLLAGQNTAENLIRNSKISSFQTQARTGRQDQSSPQLIGGINTLLQQAGQGGLKGIEATKALEVIRNRKDFGQFIDEAEKGGVRSPIIQGGVNGGINNPRVRQDGGRNNFNDGATRFQQSNDAFKTQVAAFAQSITTLEKTIGAIPKTIELTGKHEVNVNVNGVEVFGAITPMVENLVTKSVNEAFKARGDQFAGEDKLRNNLG